MLNELVEFPYYKVRTQRAEGSWRDMFIDRHIRNERNQLSEKVLNVSRKFMILTIQYEEQSEADIENLVKGIERSVNTTYGKLHRVYQGSDKKIVAAVEKIMKLTQ